MSRHHLWAEPFLWIHAAGIVTLPLWVLVVLVGLATGDPLLPVGLEKLLVELAVLPVVWMQMWRPFYIFSAVVVTVPPAQLDERRRQVLAGFQQSLYRFVVLPIVSALVVGYVGWSYDVAPLFASLSPIHQAPGSRVMGLLIAVVGVLGMTLFAQVPAAVGLLLMHSDDEAQSWLPVPTDRIPWEFSVVGRPLEKLETWLPRWQQGSPTVEMEVEEEIVGIADVADVTPEDLLEDLDPQDSDLDPDTSAADE